MYNFEQDGQKELQRPLEVAYWVPSSPGMTLFPNSAQDSLTPKYWNLTLAVEDADAEEDVEVVVLVVLLVVEELVVLLALVALEVEVPFRHCIEYRISAFSP
jgi:hypothetical protein